MILLTKGKKEVMENQDASEGPQRRGSRNVTNFQAQNMAFDGGDINNTKATFRQDNHPIAGQGQESYKRPRKLDGKKVKQFIKKINEQTRHYIEKNSNDIDKRVDENYNQQIKIVSPPNNKECNPQEEVIDVTKLIEKLKQQEGRKRNAIIGQPGSGKTVMMSRLAESFMMSNDLMKQSGKFSRRHITYGIGLKKHEFDVIYYLGIKDINRKNHTTLAEALFDRSITGLPSELAVHGMKSIEKKKTKMKIFMDGLDQADWTPDNTRKISIWESATTELIFGNLISGHLLPNVLITLSSSGLVTTSLPKPLQPNVIVELFGFSKKDVKSIHRKLTGENFLADWDELCNSGMLHMCLTPQLLFLYIELRKGDKKYAPESATSVMIKLGESLKYQDNFKDNIDDVIEKLKPMAFRGTMEQRVFFTNQDLESAEIDYKDISEVVIKMDIWNSTHQRLLDGKSYFYFCHEAMQKILSAQSAVENGIEDFKKFVDNEIHKSHLVMVRNFLCGILVNKKVQERLKASKIFKIAENIQEKGEYLMNSILQQLKKELTPEQRLHILFALKEANDLDILRKYADDLDFSNYPRSSASIQVLYSVIKQLYEVSTLSLAYCGIDDDLFDALASSARGKQVKVATLNLSGNLIWQRKADIFSEILKFMKVGQLIVDIPVIDEGTVDKPSFWSLVKIVRDGGVRTLNLTLNKTSSDEQNFKVYGAKVITDGDINLQKYFDDGATKFLIEFPECRKTTYIQDLFLTVMRSSGDGTNMSEQIDKVKLTANQTLRLEKYLTGVSINHIFWTSGEGNDEEIEALKRFLNTISVHNCTMVFPPGIKSTSCVCTLIRIASSGYSGKLLTDEISSLTLTTNQATKLSGDQYELRIRELHLIVNEVHDEDPSLLKRFFSNSKVTEVSVDFPNNANDPENSKTFNVLNEVSENGHCKVKFDGKLNELRMHVSEVKTFSTKKGSKLKIGTLHLVGDDEDTLELEGFFKNASITKCILEFPTDSSGEAVGIILLKVVDCWDSGKLQIGNIKRLGLSVHQIIRFVEKSHHLEYQGDAAQKWFLKIETLTLRNANEVSENINFFQKFFKASSIQNCEVEFPHGSESTIVAETLMNIVDAGFSGKIFTSIEELDLTFRQASKLGDKCDFKGKNLRLTEGKELTRSNTSKDFQTSLRNFSPGLSNTGVCLSEFNDGMNAASITNILQTVCKFPQCSVTASITEIQIDVYEVTELSNFGNTLKIQKLRLLGGHNCTWLPKYLRRLFRVSDINTCVVRFPPGVKGKANAQTLLTLADILNDGYAGTFTVEDVEKLTLNVNEANILRNRWKKLKPQRIQRLRLTGSIRVRQELTSLQSFFEASGAENVEKRIKCRCSKALLPCRCCCM